LQVRFETKFNNDHTWSENYLLHNVVVSRKGCDKWPNELIAERFLPLNQQARNLKHYIVGVVRQNEILIRPSAP
jgi:hypothetical protein